MKNKPKAKKNRGWWEITKYLLPLIVAIIVAYIGKPLSGKPATSPTIIQDSLKGDNIFAQSVQQNKAEGNMTVNYNYRDSSTKNKNNNGDTYIV